MAEYTIYTKLTCKYCTLSKRLLEKHGRDYFEVDIESIPSLRVLVKQAGYTTVPIIFKGAVYHGGYNELLEELEPDSDNPTDRC